MSAPFFNRESELSFLERKFNSDQAELLIFRGRRRVGKTYLLKEFSRRTNGIYFLATITSTHDQLQNFSSVLSQHFSDPVLMVDPLSSWDAAFRYLHERLTTRTPIIIDEYPYRLKANRACRLSYKDIGTNISRIIRMSS